LEERREQPGLSRHVREAPNKGKAEQTQEKRERDFGRFKKKGPAPR